MAKAWRAAVCLDLTKSQPRGLWYAALAVPGIVAVFAAFAAGVLFDRPVKVSGSNVEFTGYLWSLNWSVVYPVAGPAWLLAREVLRRKFDDGMTELAEIKLWVYQRQRTTFETTATAGKVHPEPQQSADTAADPPRGLPKAHIGLPGVVVTLALAATVVAADAHPVFAKLAGKDCALPKDWCFADRELDWSVMGAHDATIRAANTAFDVYAYAMEGALIWAVFALAWELAKKLVTLGLLFHGRALWDLGSMNMEVAHRDPDDRAGLGPLGPFFRRSYGLIFVLSMALAGHWLQQVPNATRSALMDAIVGAPPQAAPRDGAANASPDGHWAVVVSDSDTTSDVIQVPDGVDVAVWRVGAAVGGLSVVDNDGLGQDYESVPKNGTSLVAAGAPTSVPSDGGGTSPHDAGIVVLWAGTALGLAACLWPSLRLHRRLKHERESAWKDALKAEPGEGREAASARICAIDRIDRFPAGKVWAAAFLLPPLVPLAGVLQEWLLLPTLAFVAPMLWAAVKSGAGTRERT